MTVVLSPQQKTFPSFLILLFFVEMWERFSYYGMRALLILYLTSAIGFEDKNAYTIYALFAAISYSFPVVGGWLADKIIGFRSMLVIGGIVISLGHLVMAVSADQPDLLFWGLALVAIGSGFFKGNITNLLGACYQKDDPRRSQGFTLFHVGVNLGSFLASIACATVASRYGWHAGFGLAGIGMIFGLSLFFKYQHILGDIGLSSRPDLISKTYAGMTPFWIILMSAIGLSLIFSQTFLHPNFFISVLKYFAVAVLFIYGSIIVQSDSQNRRQLIAISIMMLMLMIFFALEMQLGSLINLFTERNVAKAFLGLSIPPGASQALNPICIIVIGLLLSLSLASNRVIDTLRILFSMIAMAACFFVLYLGCAQAGIDYQVDYFYLMTGIALMSLGEVLITPVVQSYVSLLAPPSHKGLIMGIMMLALAFSNLAGIVIAEFMSVPTTQGQVDLSVSLAVYQQGFWSIALFNLYVAAAFIPFALYLYAVLKRTTPQQKGL